MTTKEWNDLCKGLTIAVGDLAWMMLLWTRTTWSIQWVTVGGTMLYVFIVSFLYLLFTGVRQYNRWLHAENQRKREAAMRRKRARIELYDLTGRFDDAEFYEVEVEEDEIHKAF